MIFIFACYIPVQSPSSNVFHNVLAAHVSQQSSSSNTTPRPQEFNTSEICLSLTLHLSLRPARALPVTVTEAQTRGMGPHCDAHFTEAGEGETGDYRPLNLCLEVAPITSAPFRRPEWVTQPRQLQGRWGWTFTVYLEERAMGYLKTSPNCSVAVLCSPVSHDLLNCFHTGINAKSKFI